MSDFTVELAHGETPMIVLGSGAFAQRHRLTDGWLTSYGRASGWIPAVDDDDVEQWRARRHGDVLRLIRRDLAVVYDFDLRQMQVTEFRTSSDGVMRTEPLTPNWGKS